MRGQGGRSSQSLIMFWPVLAHSLQRLARVERLHRQFSSATARPHVKSQGASSAAQPPGGQKYLRRNSAVELATYMAAKEAKLRR